MAAECESVIVGMLSCAVCLEIATLPVETSCCHHVFCRLCVESLAACPTCRASPMQAKQSVVLTRMVDALPAKCPRGCPAVLTRGALAAHERACPNAVLACSMCELSAQRPKMLEHLVAAHGDRVLECMPLFSSAAAAGRASEEPSVHMADAPAFQDPSAAAAAARAPIDVLSVGRGGGRRVRIGRTGKHYCGGRLPGSCGCCDGRCGPTAGCNCLACMELDVAARRLPRGYLVNGDGRTARKGDTGKFYCGAAVMQGVLLCDGYCGPTDGPNCPACVALDRVAARWYPHLLRD